MAKPKKEKQEAQLSQYQKFEMVRVHRSQLNKAPYNPRVISADAKKKLKANLKRVGLLEPLIWNETSGNLVGGHQRLSQLDALEGTDDYFLDVAKVNLDDKAEKEQNIFLNNGEAQGQWDLGALAEMYKTDKLDYDATGFDFAQIYNLFGDSPVIPQPEALRKLADEIRALDGRLKAMVETTERIEDYDFYLIVIFEGNEFRAEFMKKLGQDDNRFLDGRMLMAALKTEAES